MKNDLDLPTTWKEFFTLAIPAALVLFLMLLLSSCTGGKPPEGIVNTSGCANDVSEPNDTQEEATWLTAGATYAALRICAHDEDYYSVFIPQNTCLSIFCTFAHDAGDITLYAYDSSTVSQSATNTDNEFIALPPYFLGRYVGIRVTGEQNTYSLSLSTQVCQQ